MSHIEMPHSAEAEAAVLGAVLVDQDYLAKVSGLVSPEDFYFQANQNLFRSMLEMDRAGTPIDPLVLAERHERDAAVSSAGGAAYVSKLMDGIHRLVNAGHYAEIVASTAKRRRLIQVGNNIVAQAMDGIEDAEAYAAEMAKALQGACGERGGAGFKTGGQVLSEVLDDLESRIGKPGLAGVPSGFEDIDKLTDGWKGGELIVVGGVSGMGKTSLVLSMAMHASKTVPVAIFSMEMSCMELGKRLLSMVGKIPSGMLRSGQLNDMYWSKATWAFSKIQGLKLYVDQSEDLNTNQIAARCRALKQNSGLGLVMVDYVQLMARDNRGDSEEQHVNSVTRSLKKMAKALDVPVIAVTSLTKDADERDGPPIRRDIRNSGAVAYHSDIIAFVYRPEAQKIMLQKKPEAWMSGVGQFIVDKQRNGPTGTVALNWNNTRAVFESANKKWEDEP